MNEKLNFEDCFCIFSASLSFKVEDLAKVKNREGESVQLPFRRPLVFFCAFTPFYAAGVCGGLRVRCGRLKHIEAPDLKTAGDPDAVRAAAGARRVCALC